MVLGKKDVLNTWGKSTYNDSESDSGRLFDSESESSQFGYDSESDSDSINISISDSDSESDSDSNFQLCRARYCEYTVANAPKILRMRLNKLL